MTTHQKTVQNTTTQKDDRALDVLQKFEGELAHLVRALHVPKNHTIDVALANETDEKCRGLLKLLETVLKYSNDMQLRVLHVTAIKLLEDLHTHSDDILQYNFDFEKLQKRVAHLHEAITDAHANKHSTSSGTSTTIENVKINEILHALNTKVASNVREGLSIGHNLMRVSKSIASVAMYVNIANESLPADVAPQTEVPSMPSVQTRRFQRAVIKMMPELVHNFLQYSSKEQSELIQQALRVFEAMPRDVFERMSIRDRKKTYELHRAIKSYKRKLKVEATEATPDVGTTIHASVDQEPITSVPIKHYTDMTFEERDELMKTIAYPITADANHNEAVAECIAVCKKLEAKLSTQHPEVAPLIQKIQASNLYEYQKALLSLI